MAKRSKMVASKANPTMTEFAMPVVHAIVDPTDSKAVNGLFNTIGHQWSASFEGERPWNNPFWLLKWPFLTTMPFFAVFESLHTFCHSSKVRSGHSISVWWYWRVHWQLWSQWDQQLHAQQAWQILSWWGWCLLGSIGGSISGSIRGLLVSRDLLILAIGLAKC